MTQEKPSLAFAIAFVERRLAEADRTVGPDDADDPRTYHARRRVEMEEVAADITIGLLASTRDRWDGAAVNILGIRSTSTSGLHGALRNWLTAARKRLEKEKRA